MKRALISVSDKRGVAEFARALHARNIEIISTGGTAELLSREGIPVRKVSDVTGFPEMMDGRVKTLHPKIHGGLLARRDDPSHMGDVRTHGIDLIDLVVVNLYPFEATVARPGVSLEQAIENIDIGGPSMIRSAAKNYRDVVVLVDPQDYNVVLEQLSTHGDVSPEERYRLMVKAFSHTAGYDAVIAGYFGRGPSETLPDQLTLRLTRRQHLRYGENPHQQASFYEPVPSGSTPYRQLHGKELSYNNLLDLDACVRVVSEFDAPCCVIVKHTNPCGVAVHDDPYQAYQHARQTDPVSAFGGVIGFNRPVDERAARDLNEVFVEAVLAPAFDAAALALLQKKKNIRLMAYDFDRGQPAGPGLYEIKKALDGYLVQTTDSFRGTPSTEAHWKVVTRRAPTAAECDALLFGWRIVTHVKSNAIVYTSADRTLGIGAGQMSRVDSAEVAVMKAAKAGLSLKGSAVASDAFFPFRDGIDAAARAGATAVIQPGGSVKDEEVITAANEHNLSMVFTSIRHFRH